MSTPEHAKSAIPSLDPATGMKLGQRYRVEPTESGHPFEGFFLDGKYFLNADLLTAVGWLEGQRFIYDQVDGKGEPVFAERHAGDISDLDLTVVDGPVLALTPMDEIEDQAATGSGKDEQGQAADADADAHGSQQKGGPTEHATGQPDEAADADDSGETGENEGTSDEREASGGDDDDDDDGDADGTNDALESDKSEASACPVSQSNNLLLTGIAGLAIGLLIGVSIGRHER